VDRALPDQSLDDDRLLTLLADCEDGFGIDILDDEVQVIPSGSFARAAEQAPFESGTLAYSSLRPLLVIFERHMEWDPDRPIREHPHAAAVARILALHVGEDRNVTYLGGDGFEDILVRDVGSSDMPNVLYVPASDPLQVGTDPRAMHQIVARLRQPDGCPWDRKQTNQTLRKAIIDEAFEIVDAIDSGDLAHLAEELGDMYLLLLMHAQIAHEAGAFSIEDVYQGIATKIVGRHPHVFGEVSAADADDVVGIWQAVKAKEKAESGRDSHKDIDGEPFSMPALTRAPKVLRDHPLVADDNTPDLLRLVAEIVARGEDPDVVLREQLRDHIRQHS
jgi:tetrapyrrole methylase family protein/MazG family protein